jgi:multiple sugar transport system ATP-binding protein
MGQVSLKNIRKSFGTVDVIKGIDLEIRDGEFLVFVGPSGCGKSTTLRMIAGLEEISSGDLFIDGQRANDLRPADRGAAMVFQSYALYPHMTVAQNMGFSLKMSGVDKKTRHEKVLQTAEILRMTDLLDRYPRDLSGGQRQRVAIGRAIVRRPKVFLFDEPLSNLDAALRVNMRIELSRLHKELGRTMIYVTHDQVEAMTMGDRIVVFNQGVIEQVGTPMQLYNRPANEFVAGFLGAPKINLIDRPQEFAAKDHRALWSAVASENRTVAHRIGVRPEHLGITSEGSGVPATVVLTEHLGDSSILYLKVDGVESLLNAKVGPQNHHFNVGQIVQLVPDGVSSLAFNDKGQLIA